MAKINQIKQVEGYIVDVFFTKHTSSNGGSYFKVKLEVVEELNSEERMSIRYNTSIDSEEQLYNIDKLIEEDTKISIECEEISGVFKTKPFSYFAPTKEAGMQTIIEDLKIKAPYKKLSVSEKIEQLLNQQ